MVVYARRWFRLASGLAAGALLAACGAVPGTPHPAVQSSSNAPPMNMYGAPHVAHPLDVSKFLKDPCSVIPPAQLQQLAAKYSLGTATSRDDVPADIAGCNYNPATPNPNTSLGNVGFLRGGAGLSGPYSSRDSDTSFTPMTIEGYPAVNTVGKGESIGCNIAVGLSDRQALAVEFDPADPDAPRTQTCPAVEAMATAAVETIKASQ